MAKVFKTLKKKAQATPLVGVILDSLKSENPRQNAPSIQAVIDNMTPPMNKLKNGDFQINQRGQSSYVQNKDELKLTVDCWIMASSSWEKTTVIPLKDGIRIQSITLDEGGASYSNSFTQILENEPEGDKTIVINVTNLTGHAKFGVLNKKDSGVILDKKELVKGINIFHFNINEEKNLIIRYFIDKNTDISIKYIDLFEGDIAYPHVKKSYQDDLWDCQAYVQKLDSRIVPLAKTWGESRNSVLIAYITLCRTMISNPTIEVTWSSWVYSSNDSDTYDVASENCNFIYRIANNELDIRITKKDGGVFNKNYDYFVNTGNDGILLSCEPL